MLYETKMIIIILSLSLSTIPKAKSHACHILQVFIMQLSALSLFKTRRHYFTVNKHIKLTIPSLIVSEPINKEMETRSLQPLNQHNNHLTQCLDSLSETAVMLLTLSSWRGIVVRSCHFCLDYCSNKHLREMIAIQVVFYLLSVWQSLFNVKILDHIYNRR